MGNPCCSCKLLTRARPTPQAALHAARIVHWDLKLENILLQHEGVGTASIADFGSATRLQVRHNTNQPLVSNTSQLSLLTKHV